MADFAYSQSEMDAAEEINSGGLQSLINLTGGIVSIVLVAGLVAWGWQLLVRDVSGVPVVEALQGPMRVEPADPGGMQADHQGLAVNRIAEGQEAAPAADSIVLAPPPVELSEDRPVPEPASVEAPVLQAEIETAPEVEPAAGGEVPAAIETVEAPTPEAAAEASSELIDQLITAEVVDERNAVIPISIAGLRRSILPAPRPAALELAATPAAPAPAEAPVSEVEVASLAAGTRLVQLGAFDEPALARQEWDRLAAAYPDFFASRGRIVQEAVSGGRTFYRLRAHGFTDLMDARRFCTALLAEGSACIPVTVR
ncbi:MAG: SPOR domain-containing protein [Pseudomonadota bacterium]